MSKSSGPSPELSLGKKITFSVVALGFLALFVELTSAVILKWVVVQHDESIDLAARSLRVFRPSTDGLPFAIRPGFDQRFQKSEFDTAIHTNNVGWRDAEDYHGEKLRAGLLGDSFMWGYGVNPGELTSDRLEAALDQGRVATYSYANGTFPIDYYLYLKLHPEVIASDVVMTIFFGNDLNFDHLSRDLRFDADGAAISANYTTMRVREAGDLEYIGKSQAPYLSRRHRVRAWLSSFSFGRLMNVAIGRYTGVYRSVPGPDDGADKLNDFHAGHLDETMKTILAHAVHTKKLVEKKRGRFFVFLIPESFQVGASYPCPYRRAICEALRADRPLQKSITAWLDERGVEVIDPSMDFIAAENAGTRLYYQWDAHWQAAGHQAAAEVIARRLRDSSAPRRGISSRK